MEKPRIEVQYFNGCPNSESVLQMVKEFISKSEMKIDFEEILVETQEAAEKYKFRGSPTLLINGKDLEGLPETKTPSLSCRYYQKGLPTEKDLQDYIVSKK
jgi:hypothetical protein